MRKWRRAARRHFSKSRQQNLLSRIPRKNYTAGERHRYRGRWTTQKSRKRDNSKGTNFKGKFKHKFWGNRTTKIRTVHIVHTVIFWHISRLFVQHLMLFYCWKIYISAVCWLARFSRQSSSTKIEISCNLWLLEFLLCISVSL